MWEPGSTLIHSVSCMIVPLSLLVVEGAALKPEHRKCDRRRTAGLMLQILTPAAPQVAGLLSAGIVELSVISHKGGQNS